MLTLMPKFLLYSGLCCAHGCVHTWTVHTDCDCTVVLLTNQSIASIQGIPHTTQTESNVKIGFPDQKKDCSHPKNEYSKQIDKDAPNTYPFMTIRWLPRLPPTSDILM